MLEDWLKKSESYQNQRSRKWIEWRRHRITASDVPAILGLSPYKDALDVWMEKVGLEYGQIDDGNVAAMQRGVDAERQIIELWKAQMGLYCEPIVVEHPEYSWLAASLDGWCEERNWVVEVKFPSKETHQFALIGEIPPQYRDQVQVQLMCAQAQIAHYVSYDGKNIAIVEVKADIYRQSEILEQLKRFRNFILSKTPPLTRDQLALQMEEKRLKARLKEIRAQLITL